MKWNIIQTLIWRKPKRVDVFGNIHAKPETEDYSLLGPLYQSPKKFSLYHEGLETEIGAAEVSPYSLMPNVELDEDYRSSRDGQNIKRDIEGAEEAIMKFYKRIFPQISARHSSSLGLVETTERILNGQNSKDTNPGILE